MLRFFQMVSDPLSYSGNAADVVFDVEPANPCAIIGLDAYATSREFALKTLLARLSVATREYMNGDPFPLGLLMPTAPAVAGNALGRPYWPGATIPTPDGGMAGGIVINPGEPVRLRVTDATAGSAQISQVVLQCVEFPPDCADAARMALIHERMRRGVGELYFAGHSHVYTAAATTLLAAQPTRPNRTEVIRRLGVRGLALETAGAAVAESDFALLKAKLHTKGDRAPHNAAVAARAIIGHGAFDPRAGMVDMLAEGRAFVELTTPAPAGSRTAYFVQMFEGREPGGELLRAATAIS